MAHGFGSPEILDSGFSSNLVLHSPGFSKIGVGKTLAESDASVGGFGANDYDFMADGYSTFLNPSPKDLTSWPKSVAERWKRIHSPKSRNELALISWNTNGRLDLRGCRESLIRSWVGKGYVDIALIQETLKKNGSSLFDMFGPDWWNISSWAVSNLGRGSGGCTIFGQPSLFSKDSFMKKVGRICGSFIGDGLVLDVYFPTKAGGKSMASYRKEFSFFVDELISVVSVSNAGQCDGKVSWIICGNDTNSQFAGTGLPPRKKDDWADVEIRRFMKRFDLASLTEELCPSKHTRINSRGHQSCLDTFLVSKKLLNSGAVTMYEVVDWIETGSDHCPIYLRAKVYPDWTKRSKLPAIRILKTSGLRSLRKKLEITDCRVSLVADIMDAFGTVSWSEAQNRKDMNAL